MDIAHAGEPVNRAWYLLALCSAALGCSDSYENLQGASEPFQIRSAQFFRGALPGSQPTDEPYVPGAPPQVRIATGNYIIPQGTTGLRFTGSVTGNAWSAGMLLSGQGNGWWMIGAGDIDATQTPPGYTIGGSADFANTIPVGPTFLIGVALDAQGHAGPQYPQAICISSAGPDGAAPCGGADPPVAVITLSWDTQVDLDLQVVAPDGTIVSPAHPTLHEPPKTGPVDPNQPHINRDSNANCLIDGQRSESLIWPTVPPDKGTTEYPSGTYLIYANLFDPCGQQAVTFHARVSQAVAGSSDDGAAGAGDGASMVEKVVFDQAGEMIARQANSTKGLGLYVGKYVF
jgi:hypothetical protein